jgi:carboxylesterase
VDQRIMEGAEPFRFEGNEIGVLVSHGITGTTHSINGTALAIEDWSQLLGTPGRAPAAR